MMYIALSSLEKSLIKTFFNEFHLSTLQFTAKTVKLRQPKTKYVPAKEKSSSTAISKHKILHEKATLRGEMRNVLTPADILPLGTLTEKQQIHALAILRFIRHMILFLKDVMFYSSRCSCKVHQNN